MDIAIMNYSNGEVDILRNIDPDFVSTFFDDDIELYLEDSGYNVNDIHYMCSDFIEVNDSICF